MAVDFSVLSANPDLTPHEVLEAVADLLEQMTRDQVLADAVLRGLGDFLVAGPDSDVTFPTPVPIVVPSIKKLYKAYATAVSTSATVSKAAADDINARTTQLIADARAALASDKAGALNAIALSRSDALNALALALANSLKGLNDLYTAKVSSFTDIFNVARNTINGIVEAQTAFVATARRGAEDARDLSRAWAEADLEVIPGRRSAKYWADQARALSDVSIVQAAVRRRKVRSDFGLLLLP